jgi:hypothetical protein
MQMNKIIVLGSGFVLIFECSEKKLPKLIFLLCFLAFKF